MVILIFCLRLSWNLFHVFRLTRCFRFTSFVWPSISRICTFKWLKKAASTGTDLIINGNKKNIKYLAKGLDTNRNWTLSKTFFFYISGIITHLNFSSTLVIYNYVNNCDFPRTASNQNKNSNHSSQPLLFIILAHAQRGNLLGSSMTWRAVTSRGPQRAATLRVHQLAFSGNVMGLQAPLMYTVLP